MKSALYFLFSCTLSLSLYAEQASLLNKEYIQNYLTHEAAWKDSHGASDGYLGAGLLYYSLVYAKKAQICVCLGSGGGFVPRIMCQAQRDLKLSKAKTILVDANIGSWGRPQWLENDSFFRKNFPEIMILTNTTHQVAMEWNRKVCIDYLHIDADHSYEGSLQDFIDYLPLMSPQGIITFHDTNGTLPCAKVIKEIRKRGFEAIDFKELGAGVALIHLGTHTLSE